MSTAKVLNADCSSPHPPQPVLPGPEAYRADPAVGGLGFLLFLLLNAVLFIRPAEIIPDIEAWPIYNVLIVACLVVSFPAILQRFRGWDKALRPSHVCVLGIFLAICLSQLCRFQFGVAYEEGYEFAKVVVYFVLLVSLLTTFSRIRAFTLCLVFCIAVLAVLALLQYHGRINIPSLETF